MNPPETQQSPQAGPKKKPKLTKAEKKAIAQQKLIDLKTQMMRDQLVRELQFTNKSFARGYDDWANMCKRIKIKQLNDELDEWKQHVDRLLDRKNYRVQFLLKTLNVAEEQHQRNVSQHYKMIYFLILFCNNMAQSMKTLYESNCLQLIDDFHTECRNRNEYQNRIQDAYESLIHAMATMTLHEVKIFDNKTNTKKEDIININITRQYGIRDATVKKITILRNQLDQVIDELKKDTVNARPQDEYDNLMVKQKFHEEDFVKQTHIAESGYETISDLQNKLTKLETECSFRISNLQLERNYFVEVYWNLKDKVKRHNENSDLEIQELAMESFEIIETFKKLFKFGELLLSLSTSCRKLQTEKEKVLSFEEDTDLPGMRGGAYNDVHTRNLAQMELLQNFTYRSSKAETHVLLLRENKEALLKENECYCNIIRNLYGTDTIEKMMREIKGSEYLSAMKEEGKF